MTQEPRQADKDARADSPLHRAWGSLITTLGTPLTVALAVLVVMIVVVLAVGLIWYLMPIFGSKSELTIIERKDLVQGLASVVQALAVVLTGTVGLIGLLFTWRNLGQTRESTQRTLKLTEQGQITERFTRAIDQLGETDDNGDPRLEIRLGGIYALERIDKESPERSYHPTVMEVLTAYVRENSRRDREEPPKPTSVTKVDAEQDRGFEQDVEPSARRAPPDIQAILDVLSRREEDCVPEQHRVRLDLRGANLLHQANLQGADLQGANLQGANLEASDLQYANLQGADLQGANLEASDLQYANLQGADLREANLQRANLLHEANLQYADLRGADLQEAWLREANLQATNLQRADLQDADLRGADLQGANLQEANLQGAWLQEANLEASDLQGADLQGADLQGANLEASDLQYANLQRANDITKYQIESTIGSSETKLPEGLNHPELWSESPEEQEDILLERIDEEQRNILLRRLSSAEESDSGK